MEYKQGSIGHLNDSQLAVLKEIREFIKKFEDIDPVRFSDFNLLRFCRGRKFDSAKVKEMIEKYVEWL